MANNKYARGLVHAARQINKKRELDMLQSSTELFLGAMCLALRDKYGFGDKRLIKVIEDVKSTIESVADDFCTIDDILQTVEKETGISIKKMTILEGEKNV